MKFWVSHENQTYGPYLLSEIADFIEQGFFNEDSLFCAENTNEWKDFASLSHHFQQADDQLIEEAKNDSAQTDKPKTARILKYVFNGVLVVFLVGLVLDKVGLLKSREESGEITERSESIETKSFDSLFKTSIKEHLDEQQSLDKADLRKVTFQTLAEVKRFVFHNNTSENKAYNDFQDLAKGWTKDLEFSESFKFYCSSIENVRFSVDGGNWQKVTATGEASFVWENKLLPETELTFAVQEDSSAKSLADEGDPKAMFALGLDYYSGEDVEELDYKKAFDLIKHAADKNLSAAMCLLSTMYMHGRGCEVDVSSSKMWLIRSAEAGYYLAQYALGTILHPTLNKGEEWNKLGFKEDENLAIEWLTRASEQGFPEAFLALGHAYMKDEKKARSFFVRGAELGNADCQAVLAKFHFDGIGKEKDLIGAATCALLALGNGTNFEEETNSLLDKIKLDDDDWITVYDLISSAFFEGNIVNKNLNLCRIYTLESANLGSIEAQFRMGQLHDYGWGVRVNKLKAYAWYTLAAHGGDEDAKKQIVELNLINGDLENAKIIAKDLLEEFGIKYQSTNAVAADNKDSVTINSKALCSFFGINNVTLDSSEYTRLRSSEIEDIVRTILLVAGLPQNFTIIESTETSFAAASTEYDENGEVYRLILFNPYNLARIQEETGSQWSITSILAHEIGHHLIGHVLDGKGSRPTKELEADKYSGNILAKMGATLEEALLALKLVNSKGSATHPHSRLRISSVTQGWNDGSAYKGTRNSVKDMLIDSGPFFGAGPVVPDSEREFYVTQINYQRVLKRFKFHIERWKRDNPSHPMAKKENWSDDEKEKWIRWYHLSGHKFAKKD